MSAQRRVNPARARVRMLDIFGHGEIDVAALRPSEREAHVEASAYASANGYPIREARLGTADRPVTRMFVPILSDADAAAFEQRFGADNGGVTLRWVPDSSGHLSMALHPGDLYLYGLNYNNNAGNTGDLRNMYSHHSRRGYSFAVRLGPARVAYLKNFLANNKEQLNGGNCMEWLPSAPVADGEMFFHAVGINRSRSGHNMRAKLIHAANELVHVVGVHVGSVEEFNALQDADLLRAPPSGGIEDAAR